MSIQSEVERLSANVQNTLEAIRQTGVSVPENATSDALPAAAAALANEKQDKLTGTQGQVVGFDSFGNAVAQEAPQTGLTQEQADQRYLQLTGGTVTGDVTIKRPDVNIDIVPTYIKAQVVPDGGPTFIVSNEFSSIKLNTGSGSAFITEHGSAVTGLISVTGDASHSGNVDQMFAVGVYDGADTQDIQEILANSKGMLIVQGEAASLGGNFEGITMLGPIQFSGNQLQYVGNPIASQDAATKDYVDSKTLAFGPQTVATSAWSNSTTYSAQGYGFRASVSLTGVTADHIPDVTFAMADAVSGNLAPLAESYAGGIYIYAKEQPTATVNITSVVCTKGA